MCSLDILQTRKQHPGGDSVRRSPHVAGFRIGVGVAATEEDVETAYSGSNEE